MYPQTTCSKKKGEKKGIPLPSNFRKHSVKLSQRSSLQDPGYLTCQYKRHMQHVDYRTLIFSEGEYCMGHTANTSLTRVKLANLQFLQSNRKLQSFKPLEQKQKERMMKGRHMERPCHTPQTKLCQQCIHSTERILTSSRTHSLSQMYFFLHDPNPTPSPTTNTENN